jgi:hypothetical protein
MDVSSYMITMVQGDTDFRYKKFLQRFTPINDVTLRSTMLQRGTIVNTVTVAQMKLQATYKSVAYLCASGCVESISHTILRLWRVQKLKIISNS